LPEGLSRGLGGTSLHALVYVQAGFLAIALSVEVERRRPGITIQRVNKDVFIVHIAHFRGGAAGADVEKAGATERAEFFQFEVAFAVENEGGIGPQDFKNEFVFVDLDGLGEDLALIVGFLDGPFAGQSLQVVDGKSRATGEERGNKQGSEQSFHEHEMDLDFAKESHACDRQSSHWQLKKRNPQEVQTPLFNPQPTPRQALHRHLNLPRCPPRKGAARENNKPGG